MEISLKEIKKYQKSRKTLTNINEIKLLGKELSEKYNLEPVQALHILNGRYDDVFKVLEKIQFKGEGDIIYPLDNGVLVKINN